MDGFNILSKIGEGSYSTVLKVQRIEDGNIYALKRVKFYKLLDSILITEVTKIINAAGQDPELAETYLLHCKGNTRLLEHLITHSITVAKANGKPEVDNAVISETSKLLMA